MSGPDNPDFPPQKYTARYELGFETDREAIEPSPRVWDFLFRAVENYVLCDPYLNSHEIRNTGGARFLMTEEAGLQDVPPLIVYFKSSEESRIVAFLTVRRVSDAEMDERPEAA